MKRNDKKNQIVSFERMLLHISGMRITCEYEIISREEGTEVSYYEMNYATGEEKRLLKKQAICDSERFIQLLNDCGVLSWDGFEGKHPKHVLDGEMFTFDAAVNDGRTIHASGSANFPKNFREFINSLYEILSSTSDQ